MMSMGRVMAATFLLLCHLFVAPAAAQPVQEEQAELGFPRVTIAVGLGNSLATVGGQAEYYAWRDRVSFFGSMGYTPRVYAEDPTGLTWAVGARGYAPGTRHRAFVDLSISQLSTIYGTDERRYGPGVQIGYQFLAAGGGTGFISTGVGLDFEARGISPVGMLSLGVGYTWRENLGSARLPRFQEAEPAGERRFTLAFGLGNSLGWVGGQAEHYLAGDRMSVLGGLGYTPALDPGDPSGVTLAGALRGYTPGQHHRGFLELSISQVSTSPLTGKRLYGPGLQVGYQFVARSGFTALASWGAGLERRHGETNAREILNLGVGYTWR